MSCSILDPRHLSLNIKIKLGHSDIKTTEVYARLNIQMKQKLLEEVHPQQNMGNSPLGPMMRI